MKIFLDENMPQKLTHSLQVLGHEVESVHTLHIEGTANGDLYGLVVHDYDLCLTRDEDFARKSRVSSTQSRIKVIRVTLRQQPQNAYASEFMTHFNKTNWDEYVNGDDWP